MKLKAKHFAWMYLIRKGQPNTDWSPYGAGYKTDPVARNLVLHDILNNGIDWKKTKEPHDSYNYEFVGTDVDGNDVKTMEGTLFTNNGNKYVFGCTFQSSNIFKVMENISGLESVELLISEELMKEL